MLLKPFCKLLILLLFFYSGISHAQTVQNSKSLLWMISGNGLKKPSYLYGTIHITDKRVFNFTDSVYRAIENSDGLAIELNPDSMMTGLFEKRMEKDTTRLIKAILSKKDFARLAPQIAARAKMPAEKVTVKILQDAPSDYSKRMFSESSMSTYMDGWLYETAKKQGKWVGGIEDLHDQLKDDPQINNADDVENELKSKLYPANQIESYVKIYLDQDIYTMAGAASFQQVLTDQFDLVTRNIKMARRIDSLTDFRSTFFAVGAAHLAGEKGLIHLLSEKGFVMTPVFSTSRSPAEKYVYAEVEAPWVTITDEDSLYTLSMPQIPERFYKDQADPTNLKMYFDMAGAVGYMCGATKTPNNFPNLDSMYNEFSRKATSEWTKFKGSKSITFSGMRGRELIGSKDGYHMRMQIFFHNNCLYYLAFMAGQESLLMSGNGQRFFSSFKPLTRKIPESWSNFSIPDEYVSALLPAKPSLMNLPISDDIKKSQYMRIFSSIDEKNEITYLLRTSRTLGDYYLPGDSASFIRQQNFLVEKVEGSLLDSLYTTCNGYPAYSFHVKTNKNVAYRCLCIHRGNREYLFAAVSSWDKRNDSSIESFFSSLKFQGFPLPVYQKTITPDSLLSTVVPGPLIFKLHSTDTTESDEEFSRYYFSYDTVSAITYYITPDTINKFRWYTSDSAFFTWSRGNYETRTDSVSAGKFVQNGKAKGYEFDVYTEAPGQVKRVRLLVNGNIVYHIFSFLPKQLLDNPAYNKFFEEFRFRNNEVSSSLYVNKACALLTALNSKDSVERTDAKMMLSKADFTTTDLPCLRDAMLKEYKMDSTWGDAVNITILSTIASLPDSENVQYIEKIYPTLDSSQKRFSYNLLNIVASNKTAESYAVLKKLICSRPVTELNYNGRYIFGETVTDSLQLAASLFPTILTAASDTNFIMPLSNITNILLDSNMITVDMIRPYSQKWQQAAQKYLQVYRLGDKDVYVDFMPDLLEILGKLNTADDLKLLQQYALLKEKYLANAAIKILARNNQPLPPSALLYLASDNSYRKTLYDNLKEVKKQKYFPVKYLTQKYFAEAALFEIASDEEAPKLTFLGERQVKYMGKLQKFYLFKVRFTYDEDEKEEYLGMAGPYNLDTHDVEVAKDGTGVYYDEPFNSKYIDKYFKALLKENEEYLKKEALSKSKD